MFGGVVLRDVLTGAIRELAVTGLFIAIGHDPRTELFRGQLDLDDSGRLPVASLSTRTNIPGVFGAGDVVDHTYRQAVTAAGSGASAALDAERYLAALTTPGPRDESKRRDPSCWPSTGHVSTGPSAPSSALSMPTRRRKRREADFWCFDPDEQSPFLV